MTGIPPYVELEEANQYRELNKMTKEQLLERHWILGTKQLNKIITLFLTVVIESAIILAYIVTKFVR